MPSLTSLQTHSLHYTLPPSQESDWALLWISCHRFEQLRVEGLVLHWSSITSWRWTEEAGHNGQIG